jgi:4-hydroxy-3-polyprenylbenzoate decarboxylase
MTITSTRECVLDLERAGRLVRIESEVDPNLEIAEIHRRVYRANGPAIYFSRVRGCRFPMVSNLFGTLERARFIFRKTLGHIHRMVELRVDPRAFFRSPGRYLTLPLALPYLKPRRVSAGPVFDHQIAIHDLPMLRSWPMDGGAFITLPQVYSEDPSRPGVPHSNLGMYRVQLSGGDYQPDSEIGLHYQLHRGIGIHHRAALERGQPLPVNITVGGSPAMAVAAVMPLPEGLSELAFAGLLGGRRVRLANAEGWPLPVAAEADFCILGEVFPGEVKPEGPFGDHLGYYSLAHPFPVVRVRKVYHRMDAVWPFTVVGRPPQEDSTFGALIHEIVGPLLPSVLPGVRAVHAVDAAGVHPLLLAIGSERYVPFENASEPREVLTQASAILGQGQLSLAKYLLMVSGNDDPTLAIHDVRAFFSHVLQRIDFRRDVHFHTATTIDTLDYSGTGLHRGSKVVLAAVGPVKRSLPCELPHSLRLPPGFSAPALVMPGVLAIEAPAFHGDAAGHASDLESFCEFFTARDPLCAFPLVVLVDDSEFCARNLGNFLWVTFTRSNPAVDLSGIRASTVHKHWGCEGSLVVDARQKPHHAPPLVEDKDVTARVDVLFRKNGPLAGLD